MMGIRNDKQRRSFCWFMDDSWRGGMTPATPLARVCFLRLMAT
jgi:hypothetical protein